MRSNPRFFLAHLGGFGLASFGLVGANAWYPAHMARSFGWKAGEIGLGLGLSMIIGGLIGKPLCGFVVEYLFRRGHKDANFLWYTCCLVISTPVALVSMTSGEPMHFLVGVTLLITMLSTLAAVYVSSLNLVMPNELRGRMVAFFGATVGLVALSVGPILVAAVSDYLFGGNAIGLGMATVFGTTLPLAAIALYTGRAALREGVTRAESWTGSR